MSTNNDDKIKLLLEKVAEKKKAIKSAEKPTWHTNCSWKIGGNVSNTLNLQVVTDVNILLSMLTELYNYEKGYNESKAYLGLSDTEEPCIYNSHTISDWRKDIKTRFNILKINQTKSDLSELEKRLALLESPESKAKRELEEIERLLD